MNDFLSIIKNYNKEVFIFVILISILVYVITVWRNLHLYKFGKTLAFDSFVITIFWILFLGRIAFIFDNLSSYKQYSWHYLPIRSSLAGIKFMDSFPWTMFAVWDGIEIYLIIPIAFVLNLIILRKFVIRSKDLTRFFNSRIFIIFAYSYLLLLIGAITFNKTHYVITNSFILSIFPAKVDLVLLLLIIFTIMFIVFMEVFVKRLKRNSQNFWMETAFFLLLVLPLFMLPFFMQHESLIFNFNILQIIVFFVLVVYLVDRLNNISYKSIKEKQQRKNQIVGRNYANIFRRTDLVQSRQQSRVDDIDYKLSFSNYNNAKNSQLSITERIRASINKLKRIIK